MTVANLPPLLDGRGRRTVAEPDIAALLQLCGWFSADGGAAAGVRATLDALVAAGLPYATSAGTRSFDPAEVINFVKSARGRDGGFWQRYVGTGRAYLAEAVSGDAGADPPDLAQLPPRRFNVEIRRTFGLHGGAPGARLRLRLPLPIAETGSALVVDPLLPDAAECTISPGRLEARLVRPPGDAVSLAARVSFVASPAAADERPPADHELRAFPPSRVSALAEQLAGRIRDPIAAVGAFYDRLLDGFTCGVIPYDRLAGTDAPGWSLAAGWYDCRVAAMLLVDLCRARAIPARLVGGYLLWRVPTEHYWAEVWLPGLGWRPFDLLGWDLSAGGEDRAWRRLFAGQADYRMITQRLPDVFTGAPGVGFPPAWHRLVRAIPGGSETRFVAIPDGRLIYSEAMRIDPDRSEQEG